MQQRRVSPDSSQKARLYNVIDAEWELRSMGHASAVLSKSSALPAQAFLNSPSMAPILSELAVGLTFRPGAWKDVLSKNAKPGRSLYIREDPLPLTHKCLEAYQKAFLADMPWAHLMKVPWQRVLRPEIVHLSLSLRAPPF
jgi:hypothetical protein